MSTDSEPNGPQVRVDPAEVDTAWLRAAIATNRHLTYPGNQAVRTAGAIEDMRRRGQDPAE